MSQYPRDARNASLECTDCESPVVKTPEEQFVCVDCGTETAQ